MGWGNGPPIIRACGKGAAVELASGGRLECLGGRLGKGALPPPPVVDDAQAYVPLCLPPGYPGGLGDECFGLGVDGGVSGGLRSLGTCANCIFCFGTL
jgi:hypothetical protein